MEEVKLRQIYERHADTVFSVAVGYGLQKSDCEDILQETFLRLIKSAPVLNSQEHEKAWLIVVAQNLCKNLFRKKHRSDLPLEDWDAVVELESEAQDILDAINSLPLRLRPVVHLFYYEEFTTKEIAEILNRNHSTVRNQLADSRKLLLEYLSK